MGLVRRCTEVQIRALVSRETKQPRKQIDSRSASYGVTLSNYAADAKHFEPHDDAGMQSCVPSLAIWPVVSAFGESN